MGGPCSFPTAVSAIGPVAVGTLLWTNRGEPQLTVVVKARFAFRHDATMVLTQAPELALADEHSGGDPTKSLTAASDIVPYRPRADVWLTGRAYGPARREVAVSLVRLAVYRRQVALMDKVVHIVGDRATPNDEPAPFGSMPLTFERAYGGIGFDDNPVGVGADERPLLPNLVHSERGDAVGGLGPISRYWKMRGAFVSPLVRRGLQQSVPAIPDGFAWGYFQVAPPDQRIPFLHGDEWVVVDGVHPTLLRVQSRLPKVRGVARLLQVDGSDRGDAIALVADTLAIDAERQTCSVSWRGTVAVHSRTDLAQTLVSGAVVLDGAEADWAEARTHIAHATVNRAYPTVGATIVDHDADDGARRGADQTDDQGSQVTDDANDELGKTSDEVSHPDHPGEMSSGQHRHTQIDSGDWSTDGWPSYALGDEEEVTETYGRGELRAISEDRPTQVEHPSLPMAIDTEPGRPPRLEEDMAWVDEPAIEPSPSGHDSTKGAAEAPKHNSDSPRRMVSLPPPAFDAQAYEDSLRQAGAGEDDIAYLMGEVQQDQGGSDSE